MAMRTCWVDEARRHPERGDCALVHVREPAVVDPKRDLADYLAAAERLGARIGAVFETHPHADFGQMHLAERTGAPIYVSEEYPAPYPHRSLKHGETSQSAAWLTGC